jgi:hypothetical protein
MSGGWGQLQGSPWGSMGGGVLSSPRPRQSPWSGQPSFMGGYGLLGGGSGNVGLLNQPGYNVTPQHQQQPAAGQIGAAVMPQQQPQSGQIGPAVMPQQPVSQPATTVMPQQPIGQLSTTVMPQQPPSQPSTTMQPPNPGFGGAGGQISTHVMPPMSGGDPAPRPPMSTGDPVPPQFAQRFGMFGAAVMPPRWR